MRSSLTRFASVLVTIVLVLSATRGTLAQQPPQNGLFVSVAAPAFDATSTTRSELRSRFVTFARERILISAAPDQPNSPTTGEPQLVLNLFPDVNIPATFERLEAGTEGNLTWIGRVPDQSLSNVSLTIGNDVIAGIVQTGDATYVLRPVGDGITRIIEIDRRDVLPDGEPQVVSFTGLEPHGSTGAQDSASTIDVIVFYTPVARRNLGGAAGLTTWVNNQIANANTSYSTSSVTQRLRLVGVHDVKQGGSNNAQTDLSRLTPDGDGWYDEVHGIRDAVRADLVHLVVGSANDACGIANLMESGQNTTSFSAYGFSVGVYDCDFKYTFAHELGHNMGANHAPTDPVSSTPVYSYAFGLKDATGGFRTLMAYACEYPGSADATCPRVTRVSNSTLTYLGRPQGSATQHNAGVFNNTAASVANFRTNSPGRLPGIPGRPTSSVAADSSITISWTAPTDGDPATGYTLEAGTADGLANLVQLPVGNSLSLRVTAPRGRYYIRVRASNNQGDGAPSDDLVLDVGAASPPNAPSGFAAAASGNDVTFSWNAPVQPPSLTGYVLEAGMSAGATIVRLPTTSTALRATGPDGTYYARVRATNDAGESGPSNEASFRLGSAAAALPGAPTNLVGGIRQSSAVLTWGAPSTGGAPDGYLIEAGSSSGAANLVGGLRIGNVLTYSAAAPNGRYYVRVKAYNRAGVGPASNEAVVIPDSGVCTGDVSATLTWNTATDVDLHMIEPNGTHVYYGRTTGTTARLDRDNTSGFGPENICVGPSAALAGFYEIFVVGYSGSAYPLTATITVRVFANTPSERYQVFTRTLSAANRTVGIRVAAADGRGGQIVEMTGTRSVPSDARTDGPFEKPPQ